MMSACSEYDLLEGIYFIHNMNPWIFVESEGIGDDIGSHNEILVRYYTFPKFNCFYTVQ